VAKDSATVLVNSKFTMSENGTDYFSGMAGSIPVNGKYTANIGSGVAYVRAGDIWLISDETWNFATLDFAQ
jgi:hypothetical protein